MKIIDWIKGQRFRLETLEFEERDDVVIIPAWQFALLVREYKERGNSILLYTFMLLCIIGIFIFLPLLL